MTRPEFSNARDLTFSHWIREKLPDSFTGFLVSDLDFIIENYKTKKIMLIETKTNNGELREWQKRLFKNIDKWLKRGTEEEDWEYLGFHVIQFEKTGFHDGKCYFDNVEILETELIKKLSIV
jgi:hypothetical protein